MKIIILLFAFTFHSFAGTFDCKKLISGNANGKSYTTGKSVDLSVLIEENDAEVRGTMVTKDGQYHREGDVDNVWAYFTDGKKVKRNGDVFTITSFDRNLIMCGMTQSPCRQWEEMTFNLKTKEGVIEKSHSYSAYVGERVYSLSLKFSCL